MGEGGRLVIPAQLRRRLGLEQGMEVILTETDDGELRVTTPAVALRRARRLVRRYVGPGDSLVDELLRERRQEVERDG